MDKPEFPLRISLGTTVRIWEAEPESNWSVFGSLILKPTQDSSFYVTYDRTNRFQGDSNFGGLIVYASDNDAAGHNHSVNSGILDNLSQLYEAIKSLCSSRRSSSTLTVSTKPGLKLRLTPPENRPRSIRAAWR